METGGLRGENPYAGFWLRVVASLIDSLILAVPTILIVWFVDPAYLTAPGQAQPSVLALLLPAGLIWIYFAGLESSSRQASLGKQVVKIVVTDLEGQPVPFSVASLRAWPMYILNLGAAVDSFFGTVGIEGVAALAVTVSCLAVALTRRKQGFHDMMANCLVIRKSAVPSAGGA
jgi:uncharacterized RDD family membrane protein YckC